MTDVSSASIIFFNSGTTEIILNTLNTLSNLRSKKLELLGIGIKEIKTIKVSNTFHPLLKKSNFLGSPTNRIIKVAQNKKIKIILAGMVAPDTHGEKYKKEFDAIYPKLSKKYNLALIPFLLEGVALNPSLNQQDGIHPNKDGTIKVSETIKKSIINIIN